MRDLGKELRLEDIEGLVKLPCGLYGKRSNSWYLRHYKHESWEKGDIMYINCRYLLENEEAYKDLHYDAYYERIQIMDHIYMMLQLRIRWPYSLNDDNDAKNWLSYRWSLMKFRIKYKLNIKLRRYHKILIWLKLIKIDKLKLGPIPWPRKYRTRTGMTRDPYIYFYAACVEFDEINYIKWTKMPIHLFRLKTWLWRSALITGKRSRLYEWLESSQNPSQEYVQLLKHYRVRAYETRVLNK